MLDRSLRCFVAPAALPCLLIATALSLAACKRSDAPPAPSTDPLKSQRDAMERAKAVGQTMQKGVDAEGRKADEESR